MAALPASVARFLSGRRLAVAGVSREPKLHVGNAIYKKLAEAGYDVFPVNPSAAEIEGVPCYPAVSAIPGPIDGVVICTRPEVAASVIRQCADKGVKRVWFHRSFGQGSFSKEALTAAKSAGMEAIEYGCPMMYLEPVDGGHKCFRLILGLFGKVPG